MLILDDRVRARVKAVREFAENPRNWYDTDHNDGPPGEKYDYTLNSGDVRVVYTFTKHKGRVFRHMSVSVPNRYPPPVVVWTMAHLFGFPTEEPDEEGFVHNPNQKWTACGPNMKEKCVVVVQDISCKVME